MSRLLTLAIGVIALQAAPAPQDPKAKKEEPRTRTFFEYRDSAQNLTLKMEDGRIELTVPAKPGDHGATTTYKADSLEDFKHRYPDQARTWALEKYLPRQGQPGDLAWSWEPFSSFTDRDDEERFRKFFEDMPPETPGAVGWLDRWLGEEHRILKDFEKRLHHFEPKEVGSAQPHRFGIRVTTLSSPLQAQLALKPHQGLLVVEVDKGGAAEAAGVKQYDVLLKISGQPIDDAERFAQQVAGALGEKEFMLEMIRGGSPLKLTIHPSHS